ncbi:FKBP-type peptidyl-prolyl cis-trans isomerase FkpA [Ferrimonas sediminum]|uniref:Peptidyl-prolyl cis-trans isomerase n=1 Tax=Ferrimonas sediminum TaxID=718193 RepID=A0A1G8SV33_9GAMM|nr:FKBP-type peptidyl-prolyl cis-trans isomerase [Ferrimonas sediminum]SDJ32440.1 FKBP-type peptidyl-prolyl cis-trans isomerase FkpA [Ferrimonas sediminum]
MRTLFKIGLVSAAVALAGCQEQAKTEEVKADAAPATTESQQWANEDQKTAYALGASFAANLAQSFDQLKELDIVIDNATVLEGIKAGLEGNSKMTEEQLAETLQAFDARIAKVAQEKEAAEAQAAKAEGEAFLAENAKKEGVKVTESGLQYKVLTEGEGAMPVAADTVEVHYRGTLIDGTEFDSSYKRGESISFPLNGVIKGWTEGLQLMTVGSKYELYIPSELAYGERGAGASIPGNAALVFEVELLSIPSQEKSNTGQEQH